MPLYTTAPLASYDPLAPVQALTDFSALEFIATQLNDPAQNGNRAQGAARMVDLSDAIIDIIITTVAQGADTLEVHVLDPTWTLMNRPSDGSPAFIDVDDAGLLIPMDVNFPRGTDSWWRLAQAQVSVDPTQPQVLVFEDRIATDLRDLGGAKHAGNNQTRAAFIYSCVKLVPGIRFVCPALGKPTDKVAGDLTEGEVIALINTTGIISTTNPVAKSATQKDAPAGRKNPAKVPGLDPTAAKKGATWTPSGWRYTKPINGLSPKELSILNPTTSGPDATDPGSPSFNPF